MALNVEEQNFVHRWAWNYVSALKSARKYHENVHAYEYPRNMDIDELTAEIESHLYDYASYKYWYGIMFGMVQAMSFKISISIYGACLRALNHLEEEAYGEHYHAKEII